MYPACLTGGGSHSTVLTLAPPRSRRKVRAAESAWLIREDKGEGPGPGERQLLLWAPEVVLQGSSGTALGDAEQIWGMIFPGPLLTAFPIYLRGQGLWLWAAS